MKITRAVTKADSCIGVVAAEQHSGPATLYISAFPHMERPKLI